MSIPEQEAGDCALMNSPFALEDSLCGKSVPKTVALQFCDLTTETRCKRQNTARNNKRERERESESERASERVRESERER